MIRIRSTYAFTLAAVLAATAAAAQDAAAPTDPASPVQAFEVASVKPSNPNPDPANPLSTVALMLPGGRRLGPADAAVRMAFQDWSGLATLAAGQIGRIGEDFVNWAPSRGNDRTLGLVNFSIFPHLDNEMMTSNRLEMAEKWAAEIGGPSYAIDDQTAVKVVGNAVEVISEGHWKQLGPAS